MTNAKPIPKALHTITVLVRIASSLGPIFGIDPLESNRQCVDKAMEILGYDLASDPHGLGDQAIAKLNAEMDRSAS